MVLLKPSEKQKIWSIVDECGLFSYAKGKPKKEAE